MGQGRERARPPFRRLAVLLAVALLGVIWGEVAGGRLPPASGPGVPTTQKVVVPVLAYHVFPQRPAAPDALDYEVAADVFEAQLFMLRARGWRSITAHDLAAMLATGARPRPRTLVITVDDGLRDGVTTALPILQRHGFVATFFVIAGRMGTTGYLTWDDVRRLRDAGMEIGSHTSSHPRLGDVTPDQAVADVREAQRAIGAELGDPPLTFAYPGGSYNDAAIQAVREAGLLAAFTTARGNTFSWADRFTIPRLNVNADWSPRLLLRYVRSGS